MKKIIIIGISLVLLVAVSVLVWQHFRDAKFRREAVGSWSNGGKFVMTITPGGGFAFGTSPSHDSISGTWQIRDGVFLTTTTNCTAHGGSALIGGHMRFRIIHLDDYQFVYKLGDDKTTTTLTRR